MATKQKPSPVKPWRPTKEQLAAAHGKSVPDLIATDLRVLFVGINPGLYTAAIGHHFGRPGNRFWPALHRGGFTDRVLSAFEEHELLNAGVGITNVVNRATARADELTSEELVAGGRRLAAMIRRYRVRTVAFLGLTAYRTAFGRPAAPIGPQAERLQEAAVWVLPNPSGLNAHYRLDDFGRMFGELREAAFAESRDHRSNRRPSLRAVSGFRVAKTLATPPAPPSEGGDSERIDHSGH